MDACFVVDPNMVTKKKDNKEIEVQEGWLGRVLPFELVQQMYLKGDYDALCEKQKKLNGVSNDLTELVASIAGYEDGASVLNDDNNAFVAKEVATKLDSIYDSIDTDETSVSFALSRSSGIVSAPQLHMVERTFESVSATLSRSEPA